MHLVKDCFRPWRRGVIFSGALALCFALSQVQAKAAGIVKVIFLHPQNYSDPAFRNTTSVTPPWQVMNELGQAIQRMGQVYLSDDQTLTVEVLNIQLARYYNSWAFPGNQARYLSHTRPPPSIRLRYTLKVNGVVIIAAEETLSDINYLLDPLAPHSSNALSYEKALLDEWFQKRFVRMEPAI
ncbi:DUF3016 domain-containing protein [Beijerinckia indica]|uniref:DUF3016 domain-containing protein n=1 Tax=Beijerinckia indica subsp. indica (strain ATCC 9039 / DSM 1715 / NCIMB 8712) TaxID=395963 RepID=B2IKP6_BEII9|nr:DUF3016 domain-containing protein [Beijerinckia indica]ACB95085.1 conserved hypothetical protein [Beijerinckia indica subsp. indica ATCC 9039]